nr:helix-turn-helix transcriptional regulator [Nannocystis pusilla]
MAAALREARARSGLTQAELQRRLAEALGVTTVAPTTVSRYERAELAPPWGTLDALCELLTGREDALIDALAQALAGHPPK